jgi:3-oxoacyl-[acyl-carrier protein] reductase
MNAVITGATKGMGLAIARTLAAAGYDLAICARDPRELETLSLDLNRAFGTEVYWMKADLSRKEEVMAFAAFVLEHFPAPGVLIHNAGLYVPLSLLQEEEGDMEKQFQTNLYAPYYLTRALASGMQEQKSGHIFTICSTASKEPVPGAGSYTMSKFALYAFTLCLREELKGTGIKVTAVLPGATFTDSWKGTAIPKEYFLDPMDIAGAILHTLQLPPSANTDEILMRPAQGHL